MVEIPQSLLTDPTIMAKAAEANMTPAQYLEAVRQDNINPNKAPALSSTEVTADMMKPPVLQDGATVGPNKPNMGVLAPQADTSQLATSYETMTPAQALAIAQNRGTGTSPAGSEFPGLGADFSGIQDFDALMAQRAQDSRTGVDAGLLARQAEAGDQGALLELKRRESENEKTEGFHRMPDGSMMADADMSGDAGQYSTGPAQAAPAIRNGLTPNPSAMGAADPYAPAVGALTDPAQPDPPQAAALSNTSSSASSGGIGGTTNQSTSRSYSPSTGNLRNSNMAYGKANTAEMLIRMGGKMSENAINGWNASTGAAAEEYGVIQGERRDADTAATTASEATRLAELRARAVGSKAGSKEAAKNSKALDTVNDSLWGMQNGLDAIEASRAAGGNLTGLGGMFKSLRDAFTGDPDANRRLTLERLKVNDALLRTAETKGAISNSEMSLFLKPAPTNFKDEQVWVDWIKLRMEALRRVQTRLQGGVVLGPGERASNFGTYGSEGEFKFSPDMQAAYDKYKQ
jgi:hypothetical protein